MSKKLADLKSECENTEILEWVREAQEGNIRAFELIYKEFYGRLYLHAKRMLNDEGLAEEVTQETFIKAWQKLGQYRFDSKIYTWLNRIATNLSIDKLRLKEEKISRSSAEYEDIHFSTKPQHEDTLALDKLIRLLPDKARAIVLLYEIEGYSHGEIAKLLDIAEGTSKAQLFRARALLREALAA